VTPHVLILGQDQVLVNSRALIVRGLGYRVWCTQDTEEAKQLSQAESIDILILCHTAPNSQRIDLLRTSRNSNPAVRCLWPLNLVGNAAPEGALGFCMTEGPERFVQHVKSLARTR
jgi:CheY-like chemotaxis protein